MEYTHNLEFQVRDYECDMQGVVNNAVYQNYLEHSRHEFLLSRGINFSAMAEQNINLVVIRAELDYRNSLRSNDSFAVRSRVQKSSKLRFEFHQDIFRLPDQQLILQARICGTVLNHRGRPYLPDFLTRLIDS